MAQQTTYICRELIDQMNRTAKECDDEIVRTYYNKRLYPLIEIASKYQSAVDDYMKLLDDYERRIKNLLGTTGNGFGFDLRERAR